MAREPAAVADARARLQSAVGNEVMVEAAAVTAAFHGYVRVADGTGIPVDDLVVATSADLRDELGINAYTGRENTNLSIAPRPAQDFNPHLHDNSR
ncbi:MAG: hypothetical protein ACR2P0_16495 [Acidimicrobiales bacterium]